MHEISLALSMIDTIVGSAQQAGARQVKRVYVSIGMARDVIPELMDMTFKRFTQGTVAEGAELIVTQVPVSARCEDCGLVFPLDLFDENTWKCPHCDVSHYKLHTGMEFCIDRIEVVRGAADKIACKAHAA